MSRARHNSSDLVSWEQYIFEALNSLKLLGGSNNANSLGSMCRDTEVRRSAIELLNQHPQRDGWFDTLVAAKVATWIVHKEEEGMVNGFIPEAARVRLLKHEAGPQKQYAKIYCSKFVVENGIAKREALPPVTIIL